MIFKPDSIDNLPQNFGIYKFKDLNGKIIYIGKAINLKKRIFSYFKGKTDSAKNDLIRKFTKSIEIIELEGELEALILEAKLINFFKPKYNVIWKDDKSYVYIKITKDIYPRILVSRRNEDAKVIFGPFPSANITRKIIVFLRTIFPFCNQSPNIKRVCFYNHLDLCNPCPAQIIKTKGIQRINLTKDYLSNINNNQRLLEGKSKTLLTSLESNMLKLANDYNFEEAAELRDKITNLKKLIRINNFNPEAYFSTPNLNFQKAKLERDNLKEILSQYIKITKNIRTIECYDISNISGKLATGSLVRFKDGFPDKSNYRRFRINLLNTPNDFKMLKEVFERRFKRIDWPLPDLIMVDGGALQLQVLLNALMTFKLQIPAISLAKRFEEIYVYSNNKYNILKLEKNSLALNLFMRIRDEAHRFAITYHRILRLKNMFDLKTEFNFK